MALHNTQCPHCFTTYVISDEQLRVSEGMVRCGTCRERFQARLLDGEAETPRFDPRKVFIEPLTEERNKPNSAVEKVLADAEPQEFSFADPHTETEKSISLSDVSESVNSDLSLDIDEEAPITPVDSKQLSAEEMLANIRAKQQHQLEQQAEIDAPQNPSEATTIEPAAEKPSLENPSTEKVVQQELALPASKNIEPTKTSTPQTSNKQALINQVDSLLDNKLANAPAATGVEIANLESNAEEPFQLDRKPKAIAKPRSWFSLLLALPL